MPDKARRPCPGRGRRTASCPNLLKGSEKQCVECEPFVKSAVRRYDKARDQTPGRKFLHSTTWRKIAKAKLDRDPLCERCLAKGLIVAATLAHHRDHDELNNDPSNHESLDNACHEAEHKGERWGR